MTRRPCRPRSTRGRSQIATIVVLATIIAGAVGLTVYMTLGGSGKDPEASPLHFWCVEQQKQVDIDPATLSEEATHMLDMSPETARITNPETGRDTLVTMWACPSCKKPFMPDWLKSGRPVARARTICPYCQIDLDQWERDHRPDAR